MRVGELAHLAAEAGTIVEPTGLQGIEVFPDDREQPPKMIVLSGRGSCGR